MRAKPAATLEGEAQNGDVRARLHGEVKVALPARDVEAHPRVLHHRGACLAKPEHGVPGRGAIAELAPEIGCSHMARRAYHNARNVAIRPKPELC